VAIRRPAVAAAERSERGPQGWASLGRLARRLADFFRTEPGGVRLRTLTLTRWVAVVGQLFTLLLVHFSLDIRLPLAALLPAVALSAAINLALGVAYKATARVSEGSASLLLAFDILQLVYLLALTGGLQNPFAMLLLVPVAIAATTLGRGWTFALTALTLVGIGLLAVFPGTLPWRGTALVLPALYLVAAWAALSMATVLTAIYAWSVAEEARRRATALAATQLALARERAMSALGGQAAAAAHLLGSPLATINVIAKELVRELPAGSPMAADVEVLLAQARRCRDILQGLGRRGRLDEHDQFTRAPLSSLVETIAHEHERLGVLVAVRVERPDETAEPELVATPELRHSLANLIDNAIRFATHEVVVTIRPSRQGLELLIDDDGPGFPPEVLDWLGEPYLSTRRAEGGLGLGVFIAITLLARTGARLHVDNKIKGARVTVRWPPRAVERGIEEAAHERGTG
jgi:two-component system sensor histidine kinase RegB